jgi:methylenetetrahydrofolate reductase (NADPH)
VFEAAPAIEWATQVRAAGVHARLVAGLAGPATLPTLFKFALRCGVGQSMRALGARPTSLVHLTREQGPEHLMRDIANDPSGAIDGLHFFCFGGYRRTAEWLRSVAAD